MTIEEGKEYAEKKIHEALSEKNIDIGKMEWKNTSDSKYLLTMNANKKIIDKDFSERNLTGKHRLNLERQILSVIIKAGDLS